MTPKKIYIADDEEKIGSILKDFLSKEGYDVTLYYDGSSVLEAFNHTPADMLILDVVMPKMDGFSVCSAIREKSSVPIILLTAKDTLHDKIAGLTIGSDDYLTKPFSPMELIARVKSLFRRVRLDKTEELSNNQLSIHDLTLDSNTRMALVSGRDIALTGTEFKLLYYLVYYKNKAVSRNELLENIWGFHAEVETRATDDMVKRIRKKLNHANSAVKIETIWGFGFKINEDGGLQ